MRAISLLCFVIAAAAGCARTGVTTPANEPTWLADSIQRIRTEPVRNPPAVVSRYEFRDEIITYGITPGCCDFYNVLLDTSGNAICAPSGGITGRGDGRCPAALLEEPRRVTIVWRDDRSR